MRALVAAQRAETKTDGLVDDLAAIRDELVGMRAAQHDIYSEMRRFTGAQVEVGSSLGNIVMVQSRLSDEIAGLTRAMRDMRGVFDRYSHVFADFAKLVTKVDDLVTLKAKVEGGWKVIVWIAGASAGVGAAISVGIGALAWLAGYFKG